MGIIPLVSCWWFLGSLRCPGGHDLTGSTALCPADVSTCLFVSVWTLGASASGSTPGLLLSGHTLPAPEHTLTTASPFVLPGRPSFPGMLEGRSKIWAWVACCPGCLSLGRIIFRGCLGWLAPPLSEKVCHMQAVQVNLQSGPILGPQCPGHIHSPGSDERVELPSLVLCRLFGACGPLGPGSHSRLSLTSRNYSCPQDAQGLPYPLALGALSLLTSVLSGPWEVWRFLEGHRWEHPGMGLCVAVVLTFLRIHAHGPILHSYWRWMWDLIFLRSHHCLVFLCILSWLFW